MWPATWSASACPALADPAQVDALSRPATGS
jgi:hypothetical protein